MGEDAAPRSGGEPSTLRADLVFWVGALFVGMAILGLQRIALWIAHRPPADLGGTVGGLALAMLHGLRFDASGLAYLLLLAIVVTTTIGRVRRGGGGEGPAVAAVWILAAAVAVVDLHFFGEFRTRVDFVLLEYLDDPGTALGMVIHDLGWVAFVVNLVVLGVLSYLAVRFAKLMRGSRSTQPRVWHRVLLVALLAALARGGTGRPLRPQDADASPHRFVNQLSLNGLFTLERHAYEALTDGNGVPEYGIDPRLDVLVARRVFAQGEEFLSEDHPALRAHPTADGAAPRDLNVVMVILESFSGRYVGALGAGSRGVTPALDEIAGEGVLFRRFYANGPATNRSLPALLAGIPCLPTRTALTKSAEGQQAFLTLGTVLSDAGYRTAFCTSGAESWENLGGWCRNQGFARVVDRDAFAVDDSVSVFGPPDHVLLDRVLAVGDELASGGPFAVVALTSSNHPPFALPDDLPADIDAPAPPDAAAELSAERVRAFRYADWAVDRFIREARTRDWGANTLFVVVGDHGLHVAPQAMVDLDRRHVPLLLLGPADAGLAPRVVDDVGSHVDVLPTILGILRRPGPHAAWGRDLLWVDEADAWRERYAVLGPHGGQRLYGLLTNSGTFLVDRFDAGATLFTVAADGRTLSPSEPPPESLRRIGRSYLQAAHRTVAGRRAGDVRR